VGVVTKPFHFEGAHRMRLAESGIAELQQYVDTLIIIPNQNLFRIANEKTTFADAFKMADDVLHSGVRGVTDLMVMPGLINLDFADIRSVMTEMGKAMMGTGEATGERRSIQAAEAAISNPLLDDVSMKGARGVLINITGGYDMTLFEVDEAANRIRDEVDPDANIIFGSTFDPSLEGIMRVSVVATGIDAAAMALSRAAAVASQAQNHGQPHAAPAPAHAPAQPVHAPAAPVQALRKAPAAPPTAQARTVDYHSTLVAAPVQPAAPTPVMTAPAPAPVQPAARTHEPEPVHAAHAHDGHDHGHEAGAAPASRPEPATVTRISGPLRGERRDGVFIAPRPVESGNRQAAAVAEPAQPRQPAPAEVIDDRPRKRGLSLFERMTGWSRSGDAEGLRPIPEPAPAQAPRPQTVARPPQPAPQNAAKAAPQAPRMVHDHGDRGRSGRGEEEMLDIPAFLRRQAN
jgi:cell division protein FtsZ